MDNKQLEQLVKQLTQELGFETTETRNRDSLDFHDVHIGSLKRAIEVAYKTGFNDGLARSH